NRNAIDMSPSTKIVRANTTRFGPKQADSIAPSNAPKALATIRWIAKGTVELSGDCMTTRVAMTAQYASGNPTSRATNTESVAATAVRTACHTDGRFSSLQVQSFITPIISGRVWMWQACGTASQSVNCAFNVRLFGS